MFNFKIFIFQNQEQLALNYILSMIHKFPTNPKLRTVYVNLILRNPSKDKKSLHAGSKIAESVLALTHSKLLKRCVCDYFFNGFEYLRFKSLSSNSKDLSRVLALISLTKKDVNAKEQKLYAQKAIFVNPESKAAKRALELCH